MNFALSLKRPSVREWVVLFPLFFLLWYSPFVDFPIRVVTLAILSLILAGSVFLVWRFRIFRWILITLYTFSVLFLLLPAHLHLTGNRSDLRDRYCNALNSYVGCRYVWGGVGYFGIDCSGFVQKGLEDGLATRGLSTLNSDLVREAIWLYWNRTTAKVLGEGDCGRTYTVTACKTLNALDYSLLMPGDLAVTASGNHVMAYLGDKTWIAADPGKGKVTRFVIPELRNAYFSTPMKIVRWKILSG
jgi:hypothetical protein